MGEVVTQQASVPAVQDHSGYTILLVEDDHATLRVVETLLQKAGYQGGCRPIMYSVILSIDCR